MRSESQRTFTNGVRVRPSSLLGRIANRFRIAGKDMVEAQERARANRAGATPLERQQELIAFYSKYEDLVELLCDAAQYGPTLRLEARYEEIRNSLCAGYADLKPLLGAFLRPADGEADRDVFEILLSSASVSDFLQSDDGESIDRITRTREALNLYGEHLRQLADRTG